MNKYRFLLSYNKKYIVFYCKNFRIKGLYYKNGIVGSSNDYVFRYNHNINLKERHLKLLIYKI